MLREIRIVVWPVNHGANELALAGWVVDHFAVSATVVDGEADIAHHYVLGRQPRVSASVGEVR